MSNNIPLYENLGESLTSINFNGEFSNLEIRNICFSDCKA